LRQVVVGFVTASLCPADDPYTNAEPDCEADWNVTFREGLGRSKHWECIWARVRTCYHLLRIFYLHLLHQICRICNPFSCMAVDSGVD